MPDFSYLISVVLGFRNEPDDSLMKEVQNLRLENDRLREEVKRASESTPVSTLLRGLNSMPFIYCLHAEK